MYAPIKSLTFEYEIGVIPVNKDKRPIIESVNDKRGGLRTVEELEDWFGPTGSKQAQYLAAILDSPTPLFALDLDGNGLTVFQTKILPRCSECLQKAINTTMKTKTQRNGLHLVFRYRLDDFPEGIKRHDYWQGGNNDHNGIELMGRGYYLCERGPGYESLIGPEYLVTLDKDLIKELLRLLQIFEVEMTAIEELCNGSNRLEQYYDQPNRDKLVMGLSGYLHKNGLPEYLTVAIFEHLIELVGGDEEAESRFRVIRSTYEKNPKSKEVSGKDYLMDAIKNNENLFMEINRQFAKLGYEGFFDKPGAGGTTTNNNSNSNHDSSSRNKSNRDKGEGELEKAKEIFVRKYSAGIPLAEQIKIGGRSMFLQIIDGQPVFKSVIDLGQERGVILKPYQSIGSTPPIMEYEYNDTKEIEYFIELANKICVDDLYFLVKSIYKDVVATNEKELIVLLATDTIMSYFQDLFVTTHYLLLTSPPGWGTFLTSQRLRDKIFMLKTASYRMRYHEGEFVVIRSQIFLDLTYMTHDRF
jgi:hypothetical protein